MDDIRMQSIQQLRIAIENLRPRITSREDMAKKLMKINDYLIRISVSSLLLRLKVSNVIKKLSNNTDDLRANLTEEEEVDIILLIGKLRDYVEKK